MSISKVIRIAARKLMCLPGSQASSEKVGVRSLQRSRLEMVVLEDRFVPAIVYPQSSWSDNTTVRLYNNGPGWLNVTGGSGSVSVSPASGGPVGAYSLSVSGISQSGSGSGSGSGGPPGPTGSGDVTWSGAADGLYIEATGSVGSIGITGDV
ncbi:MAG: hypothetical protein ACRCZF_25765, partial [Gemmataceae bacterium]